MKRKLIAILLLITLAFLVSCSIDKEDTDVILRGRNTQSNIIIPLHTTFKDNVYKIGDSVLAYRYDTGEYHIMTATQNSSFSQLELFIIEEDNDVLEAIHYSKDSTVKIP